MLTTCQITKITQTGVTRFSSNSVEKKTLYLLEIGDEWRYKVQVEKKKSNKIINQKCVIKLKQGRDTRFLPGNTNIL